MRLTDLDGSLTHVLQAGRRYYDAEQAEFAVKHRPHSTQHDGVVARAEQRTTAAAMTLDALVDEYHGQLRDFIKQEIIAAVAAMDTTHALRLQA